MEKGDEVDAMEEGNEEMTFWDVADACVQAMEFDNAEKIYRDALRQQPNDPDILDALGDVLVQKGQAEEAVKIFQLTMKLSPDVGADKYLNMGQLSEGQTALQFYFKALEVLSGEKDSLTSGVFEGEEPDVAELNAKVVGALVAMAEIYMTDECFAPNAESECEKFLTEALKIDPQNAEALQTFASFRISQTNPEEGLKILKQSWENWRKIEELNNLPPWHFRLQTAKLFIELERPRIAAAILGKLLDEFDEDAEVWYLLGFCLNHFDPEEGHECLTKCQQLLDKQKVKDKSIREQLRHELAKAVDFQAHPEKLPELFEDDVAPEEEGDDVGDEEGDEMDDEDGMDTA